MAASEEQASGARTGCVGLGQEGSKASLTVRPSAVRVEAHSGWESREVSPDWAGCVSCGTWAQVWDRSGPRHLEVTHEQEVPNTRGLDTIQALGSALIPMGQLLRLSQG